jgi:hypothetical protein
LLYRPVSTQAATKNEHHFPFTGGVIKLMYPNISRLAQNILAIPDTAIHPLAVMMPNVMTAGSAVAIECIFSGGRDAISLRRASLKPEAIQEVMTSKHKLLLARRAHLREEALAQSTFV